MRAVPATLVIAAVLGGCAPLQGRAAADAPGRPLPELPVEQVSGPAPGLTPPEPNEVLDPLGRLPAGEPVSLTASAVDVASLLTALGESVGISLVVDPEIDERITVSFEDVPAREALRAVLAEAGLFIAAGPPTPPFGPVVFYTLPVDIDLASTEAISARFGVSRRVAEFIVRSRVR